LALVAVSLPSRVTGQQAAPGPFLPLGSRLDQLVRWMQAEGGLDRLDPLTRPFRLAAVRLVVARQDTLQLTPMARRAFAWLRTELAAANDSTTVSAELGASAYGNGRRDSFREGGRAGSGAMGGVWVSMTRGPLVAVLNPAFENRLRDDPDYTGDTSRFVAGRLQTGYVMLTGEAGDLFFGRAARNWGPDLFDGLQLSPSAYATDMLSGTLRMGRFEFTTIAQRLDDYDSTLAVPISRYFLAHRLGIRAGKGVWIALTETGVYGGPGRGLETAFLAPLNPALLTEFNEGKNVNLMWGAQLHSLLGRGLSFDGEWMIDDIQIDRGTLRDRRPWSGGITLAARYAFPDLPLHGTIGYTQVRSLTYRNSFEPYEVYAVSGVGIARTFSDYDQVLLRLETRPATRLRVSLDGSYIRQGSGDFRQPYPSDSVLALPGQGFLIAPARHSAGARLTASSEPWVGVELEGEVGVYGKVSGGSAGIAALAVRMGFNVLAGRFGAAWPGVERRSGTGWP
jgi:hypothetical protein